MEEAVLAEIEGLHRFFESWFTASVPNSDEVFGRVVSVFPSSFRMIPPSGEEIGREQILDRIRHAYGSHRTDGIRIAIEHAKVRTLAPGLALALYAESQERSGQRQTRLSSAILGAREGTPNGLEWLHVHETWLHASEAIQRGG